MGINKLNQVRLIQLHSAANHTLTVEDAANILGMPRKEVAKLMSRWVGQGHFLKVKRGLYNLAKPNALSSELDNSWVIATKLYNPCYVGALTAAEYWGLTKNKFPCTSVFCIKKPKKRNSVIQNNNYSFRTISEEAMFGLVSITYQQVEILVSDPTRTIIDFLIDPALGGGGQNIIDMFYGYLKSNHRNIDLLYNYAKKTNKGVVLKRLGYLLEHCKSGEFNIAGLCYLLKSEGYIKFDPNVGGDKLITRWGLWV